LVGRPAGPLLCSGGNPSAVERHFSSTFVRQDDEVQRKGEAVGAVVKDKLYLVTYEAAALHFFDVGVEQFRQLASTLKL
jgi:hypothetical protein